ncbi:hypothetical protein DM02DRAFT_640793 [Periconia macrospinosa]|uniref:Uncharacterized protein n=1 Tax=Periconia macrospinosa TaxID=97972 RepID=A0A2V1DXY4_9PLEO|nr:hypothetical protein DM02DRAFT_640793 [Periconia macrospinosa]
MPVFHNMPPPPKQDVRLLWLVTSTDIIVTDTMSTGNTCAAATTPTVLAGSSTDQAIDFNHLPNDIHRLILLELADSSTSDILSLAQASKSLRDTAFSFAYREIVVSQGPKKSWNQIAYPVLIEKFHQDENYQLARHVRSITVKDEVPSEDLLMILDKIAQSGNLHSLAWETAAHMPRAVLDKIHATWPELEIRVAVIDRRDPKKIAHRQMDMELLSSPLLVGLTYTIYANGYQSDEPARSEWPRLTQALAAGGNIRSLQLWVRSDNFCRRDAQIVPVDEPEKLERLDLISGLCFPRLEELSIQHENWSTYLWDADHCIAFRDSIDCSRLRTLDFGKTNPIAFFRCLTGLLPKLKTLRFTAVEDAIEPARSFVESLDSLEHLGLARAQKGIDQLWPAIIKHRNTLKTLILGPTLGSWCSPLYIDISRLEAIAATFLHLERFGWDAPCKTNVDPAHLAILSTMCLKKLDLYLHIPDEASVFSERLVQDAMGSIPAPSLDKSGSIAAAIDIAEVISKSQTDPLQWLMLHISRTGYEDRGQPYMMDTALQIRRTNDTSQSPASKYKARGKMEWYRSLAEDTLLFEEE